MSRSSTTANSPVESLLDGFVGYLREERGVSAATAETYVPDPAPLPCAAWPTGHR